MRVKSSENKTLGEWLASSSLVVTAGPITERLKREFLPNVDWRKYPYHQLQYRYPELLQKVYRQYLDIAMRSDCPIIVHTPPSQIDQKLHPTSREDVSACIEDACAFMKDLRGGYLQDAHRIFISGILECRGNSYSGQQFMSEEEAYSHHLQRVQDFSDQPIDCLLANILPEINEAAGMARALEHAHVPSIFSFMITADGNLLDGTGLADAIAHIDRSCTVPPMCYMANCIHPSNLLAALWQPQNRGRTELRRLIGNKANASSLSPKELDESPIAQREDFDEMVRLQGKLHQQHGYNLLGGCCGTDDKYLVKLIEKVMEVQA